MCLIWCRIWIDFDFLLVSLFVDLYFCNPKLISFNFFVSFLSFIVWVYFKQMFSLPFFTWKKNMENSIDFRISLSPVFIIYIRKLSIFYGTLKCHRMDIFQKTCAFYRIFIRSIQYSHITPLYQRVKREKMMLSIISMSAFMMGIYSTKEKNDSCALEKLFTSDYFFFLVLLIRRISLVRIYVASVYSHTIEMKHISDVPNGCVLPHTEPIYSANVSNHFEIV